MPLPRKPPKTRTFIKCVCCGCLVGGGAYDAARRRFTLGALGQYAPQVLTQVFHGRQMGGADGGLEWRRRPMHAEELEQIGRAVAAAGEMVIDRLGDLPTADPPDVVLAEIDDDDEAARVAREWLDDAEHELRRRQEIVEAEFQSRENARRRTY